MSNSNQRPWYKDPKILIPAIVVLLAALITGIFFSISQHPTGTIFKEIGGDTDTDGNYELSWDSSERAKKYTLQEYGDSSFESPQTVYSGPETKKQIYGKSSGDYYYRVRACNNVGESEWSPIRKMTVVTSPLLTPIPTPTSASEGGEGIAIQTPTPTTNIIDSMESTMVWITHKDDNGSSMNKKLMPGWTGDGIEIFYNLKKCGWVLISKEIDPKKLSEYKGIRFYYKGSGEPNTIELKLIYEDTTTFDVKWHGATVRDDWMPVEVPYSSFNCCGSNELDLEKVRKIEFAISNKPDEGDKYGSGWVIIDDVQGITS